MGRAKDQICCIHPPPFNLQKLFGWANIQKKKKNPEKWGEGVVMQIIVSVEQNGKRLCEGRMGIWGGGGGGNQKCLRWDEMG